MGITELTEAAECDGMKGFSGYDLRHFKDGRQKLAEAAVVYSTM
jgi:hypothetical protein